MANSNAYRNYLDDVVLDADPLTLVSLLYRGAIDAIAAARVSLAKGEIAERSRQISKATAIVNELAMRLDHSKGGGVSRPLAELYDYIARRLNEANFKQTEGPLVEAQELMMTLLDAWRQCGEKIELSKVSSYSGASTGEYAPLSCMA